MTSSNRPPHRSPRGPLALAGALTLLAACGGAGAGAAPPPAGTPVQPPAPSCAAAPGGGAPTAQPPTLQRTLSDRFHEGWLASPAVADLDGDGGREIVVARAGRVLAFRPDGTIAWSRDVAGRIWASPVVADLVPSHPGLEVAVAARAVVHLLGADGAELPGFPVTWRDEIRALAAGDLDGDGALELAAATTSTLVAGGQRDLLMAWRGDGSAVPGFPPNTSGASGCDENCFVTGGYDQNLAVGDVDLDGKAELLAPHDNAYLSLHAGTGRAFDAAPAFRNRTKIQGVRFLHDLALAQQGFADDEATADQAHFTNSAPALADLDGDGRRELVVLASVQNAAQTDRLRGVALWAVRPDGTRPAAWLAPFHAPGYLAGLWDFEGTNVVGATNQVQVAELFPGRAGPELLFAGFDGLVHCVDARAQALWTYRYTASPRVLTAGLAVADLSGDGRPEVVLATYSPDAGLGRLLVLDAGGNLLHDLPLPGRGAMAVPTVADVDGDGDLEIVVPLKDAVDRGPMALVYTVPGSAGNCLPWPTGRGDLRRDGTPP